MSKSLHLFARFSPRLAELIILSHKVVLEIGLFLNLEVIKIQGCDLFLLILYIELRTLKSDLLVVLAGFGYFFNLEVWKILYIVRSWIAQIPCICKWVILAHNTIFFALLRFNFLCNWCNYFIILRKSGRFNLLRAFDNFISVLIFSFMLHWQIKVFLSYQLIYSLIV